MKINWVNVDEGHGQLGAFNACCGASRFYYKSRDSGLRLLTNHGFWSGVSWILVDRHQLQPNLATKHLRPVHRREEQIGISLGKTQICLRYDGCTAGDRSSHGGHDLLSRQDLPVPRAPCARGTEPSRHLGGAARVHNDDGTEVSGGGAGGGGGGVGGEGPVVVVSWVLGSMGEADEASG